VRPSDMCGLLFLSSSALLPPWLAWMRSTRKASLFEEIRAERMGESMGALL